MSVRVVLTPSVGTFTSLALCHCSTPLPGLTKSVLEKGISVNVTAVAPVVVGVVVVVESVGVVVGGCVLRRLSAAVTSLSAERASGPLWQLARILNPVSM